MLVEQAQLVQLVLEELRACEANWEPQVVQDPAALEVPAVLWALVVLRVVQAEQQDQQVPQVQQDQQDQQAAIPEVRVPVAAWDRWASLAVKAIVARLEQQALEAKKAILAMLEQWGHKVQQDHAVIQAPQDHKVFLAILDPRVLQDQQVPQDQQAQLGQAD